ncbi:MAG: tetratricopeptide repeat protein [Xenococcaceae cyanobacterium MO_234.B1]|nr:tetratricopeptide repeat protein [Xenococcaceae cyanobacterium MO_234.B1]
MSHSSNSSSNKNQEVPPKEIESEYDAKEKADFVYLPTLKSMEKPPTKKQSLSSQGSAKPLKTAPSTIPLSTLPIPYNPNSLINKMTSTESNAAQIYLEQGLAYWAEQKWQETIEACQKAIALNPNLLEAHKTLGNALQKVGRLSEAIGHYARAIEIKPDFAEAYANLGTLYATQKKWEQALNYYEKALELKSDFPGVYRHLAKVWKNLGSPENAQKMLAQARHLETLHKDLSPEQHFQVAEQYYQQNKLSDALKHYELAVKLAPNWLEAHQKLAKITEKMGLWQQAAQYYRNILYLQSSSSAAQSSNYNQPQLPGLGVAKSSRLRLNPASQSTNNQEVVEYGSPTSRLNMLSNQKHPSTSSSASPTLISNHPPDPPDPTQDKLTLLTQQYLKQAKDKPESEKIQANLGSLYARQKKWERAIAHYKRAIQLNPNFAGAYRNLARALTKAGTPEAATEYWLRAIELEAQGVKAEEYLQLGTNLVQQGKLKPAITCYRRAVQLQPNVAEPYLKLGELFLNIGQHSQAETCYKQGLKRAPQNPQLHYNLGLTLAQQQDWDSAIEYYKKALQLQEDYWEAAHNLGEALSHKKLWSEAVPYYRRAIKLKPDFSWSYNNLGNALLELQDWSEAIKAFLQAIKLKPDFPWAYYNLGEALGKLGEWDEAITAYQGAAQIQEDLPNVQQKLGNALYQKIAQEKQTLEQDQQIALNCFHKAIAQNPDDPQNYHQAIALEQDNLELYIGLGNVLMKQKQIDEAIVAYQMALQLQPKHLETSVLLSKALLEKDPNIDPEKAIGELLDSKSTITEAEIIEPSSVTLPLQLPHSDRPKVSIIIPVYNKLEYTAQCLESLGKYLAPETDVEIIVVNDCSTDDTESRLNDVEGLILINNESNLGFIHSCNKGASTAQGEYLYFLNNDTTIHPNSIESLIEILEQDEQVGAVGSKLVYPQGALQEAGGIIWQDASGWNYGRNDNPYDPKYNYLREVDYCSGASLMVKKSTFEALNSFERDFAPAYYEDTDLCFAIRHQLALKVMYQPHSVITHYEGISSGTSTSSGIKRYQVVNAAKFKQKWQQYLETSAYLPNRGMENVPSAARKYQGNKTILVIDTYMPCYDKESGSRRLFQLLKIFKELNYHVIFAADNGIKTEPYVSELQNLQVEVIYTQDGYGVIPEEQIKARLPLVDIAWICRPELNEKYFPIIRQQSNIKIIYDTIDLHYLRMKRAWELSPDKDATQVTEWINMQARELKIAHQADLTITVTPIEQQILQQQGISEVAVVPNIHLPYLGENKEFHERHNILFIGSYTHPPNIDAVLWLCEAIMPLVWEKIPEVTVTLLGSNPTQEVIALKSDKVQVPGYISDVSSYFLSHRVFVSPLRYGAGMKGKIGQSLEYGLPIVSTDIGIEGMNLTPGKNILIANKAEKFAAQIIRLYQDEQLWQKLAANAEEALLPFTPKAVRDYCENKFRSLF